MKSKRQKPEKAYSEPINFHPLLFEKVLADALRVKPPPEKKKRRGKKKTGDDALAKDV